MRAKRLTRFTQAIGTGAIAVAVVCIVAGVMLIAAWQPSQSAITAPAQKPAAVVPTAKKASATPNKTAQAPASKAAASKTTAPAAVPAKTAASDAAVAKASTQEPATVTITGCLERHDQSFRLKDTSGTDAPKSRSWKSGFITKRSASIDVVDATNRLQLRNYVGQRVQLTGKLNDREMQVRSLLRVASSCN